MTPDCANAPNVVLHLEPMISIRFTSPDHYVVWPIIHAQLGNLHIQ